MAFSQRWNQRKYEFYYGIGMSNLMGDIGIPKDSSKNAWIHKSTIGVMGNVGLRYHLGGRHYVRGALSLGQLRANDVPDNPDYYYRGYKMSSFFTDLSVKYDFLIIKEKTKKTVYRQLGESRLKNISLPTYLTIGFGGIFNTGSLEQAQGFFTTSESFTNVAFNVSFGLGSKIRINRNTSINIEAVTHLAFSDGLDGAIGTPINHFGEWIDQYQFLTVNLIHKLRSNKKGLPKFRKR